MSVNRRVVFVIAMICFVGGFSCGVLVGRSRGIPLVERKGQWSIGIYSGSSALDFGPPENNINPVLTAKHVTDVSADFVADPFILHESQTWYMFFEVMNADSSHGDIGLATSPDGFHWTYQEIVLDEPFHLSYPYVFKWKGDFFMVPESHTAKAVRLYKADKFPAQWSISETLLVGYYIDPSIFHYDDKWWMFVETNLYDYDTLCLYHADDLLGPWVEHAMSPIIVGDANIARPAGRVLVFDDRIIRYAQDDDPIYGEKVRAFEIVELTTSKYEEVAIESPILEGSGTGWNAERMHHIDPYRIHGAKWIAAVDGYANVWVFGLDY